MIMILNEAWELPIELTPGRYVAGMYLELTIAIISFIFWVFMVQKYLHKRSKISGMLALSYFGFLEMLISTLLEKILVITGTFTYTEIVYNVKIGVIGAYGGVIFVAAYSQFIQDLFYKNNTKARNIVKIVEIMMLITIVYITLVLFIPTEKDFFQSLFLPITAVTIVFLIPQFIISAREPIIIIRKLAPEDTDEFTLYRVSLRSIAINSWIMLTYIVLFGIDLVMPQLAMSILYFIAWSCMGLSFIFAYLGYFQPKWVKKIINKR